MKHILFIAADLCPRGSEHQMVTVACLLKHEGYDVSFVCYHTNNFFEHILIENDIPVIWLKLHNYAKRLFSVRRFVRKNSFDVVISFLQADNFLNDFAAFGGHKWKVITGERSSKESILTSSRGKIFGWFQKETDYIVCNSDNARKMWLKHYPIYAEKLKVIYNNVKLPIISSEYQFRRNGKTHIIIAGAYSNVKDPQGMIRAISMLDDSQQKALSVEWYGKIDANEEAVAVYSECEKLIQQNNLESVVSLNDATQDIANRMNEADVVALFSKWEGLPNSICEAMTIGKPVLMTRISDYARLIDETNGYLCDIQNPTSIKEALEKIINTSEIELIAKGAASKKKAEALFSDQKIVSEWIKLIE